MDLCALQNISQEGETQGGAPLLLGSTLCTEGSYLLEFLPSGEKKIVPLLQDYWPILQGGKKLYHYPISFDP